MSAFPPTAEELQAMYEAPRTEHPMQSGATDLAHSRPPNWITARDLCSLQFAPIKYVVPGYIAEGLTLLAGKPKIGKSWLSMDIALAVAAGGACLGGISCEPGDVLYLALEDNRRRLQSRIRKLWEMESLANQTPVPERLHLATEWPRASEGGTAAIRDWIDQHPGARLVVVDVLAMFKTIAKGRDQTLYEADYLAIKELQVLAMDTGVAIVVVHHTRKSGAETDPFEKVSGTLGLSGAADTTIILDRDQNGCTLYGRGRDIEEIETAVEFDRQSCRWRALGHASEVSRTHERSVILTTLADNREPMRPAEIADLLGLKRNNVRQLIFKMAKAGEVVKTGGHGRYAHPDHAGDHEDSSSPDNFDNRDNRDGDDEA